MRKIKNGINSSIKVKYKDYIIPFFIIGWAGGIKDDFGIYTLNILENINLFYIIYINYYYLSKLIKK